MPVQRHPQSVQSTLTDSRISARLDGSRGGSLSLKARAARGSVGGGFRREVFQSSLAQIGLHQVLMNFASSHIGSNRREKQGEFNSIIMAQCVICMVSQIYSIYLVCRRWTHAQKHQSIKRCGKRLERHSNGVPKHIAS